MYVPWDMAGGLLPFGDLHNHRHAAPPFTHRVLAIDEPDQGPDNQVTVTAQHQHQQDHHHQQRQQQASEAVHQMNDSNIEVLEAIREPVHSEADIWGDGSYDGERDVYRLTTHKR
jgi:hypothetical protein